MFENVPNKIAEMGEKTGQILRALTLLYSA
jgi:hypothetical protein